MLRVRFHGRGGQGVKTASRVLGTALFLNRFEVQDAPRYGAERRGAPISAYVRVDTHRINERGVITQPDLVVVVDDTLVGITSAGVMAGVDAHTVLLITGEEEAVIWRERLQTPATVIALPSRRSIDQSDIPYAGIACAGAAARLIGHISAATLREAIGQELAGLPVDVIDANQMHALSAYEQMKSREGCVTERARISIYATPRPDWIDLPRDDADVSAPAIHTGLTSVKVRTGLWRTMRPVLDKDACNKCVWVCGSHCPDGVISVDDEGYPTIDFDHCKGCMICTLQCPKHAYAAVPEAKASAKAREGEAA